MTDEAYGDHFDERTPPAVRKRWRDKTLWRSRDLEELACGLIPSRSIPNVKELNDAREEIISARLIGLIVPATLETGLTWGTQGPGYVPRDVVAWFSTTFPKFPFTPADYGISTDPLYDGLDPEDMPVELDLARRAFRAVQQGCGDQDKTFKAQLIDWLSDEANHATPLSREAVERIATVANPDKLSGRRAKRK